MELNRADCVRWVADNGWSYQDTAFLLNNVEPISKISLLEILGNENAFKTVPIEIKPIVDNFHDIFGILNNDHEAAVDVNKKDYHPYKILKEIYNRFGIILVNKNPELLMLINERHYREMGTYLIKELEEKIVKPKKVRPIMRESTVDNIIGGFAELYWEARSPNSNKINQDSIIKDFLEKFPRVPGLSKSNLEKAISNGLKSIAEEKKEIVR